MAPKAPLFKATRTAFRPNVAGSSGSRQGSSTPRAGTPSNAGQQAAGLVPVPDQGDRRMTEYSAEDDVCPVCKSDRHLNPRLRLLISPCYHKMCETCISRLFALGPEPCPTCGQVLRKNQFQAQRFENLGVQKEVEIRKRVAKCFNKREEDFKDLKTYNDYLEEVEEITFNLINSVDLQQTEARIRQYTLENRDLIDHNASRSTVEASALAAREAEDRRLALLRKQEYEALEAAEKAAKEEDRKALIEALEKGDQAPKQVLKTLRKAAAKRTNERTTELEGKLSAQGSLRFLANLVDPNATKEVELVHVTPEEILAALKELDDCIPEMRLFDLLEEGYEDKATEVIMIGGGAGAKDGVKGDEGGWKKKEVWEKAVRESVAGLWDFPAA